MNDILSPTTCKTIVAAHVDAALVLNHRSQVIAANAAACNLLDADLIGHPVALFMRAPDVLNAVADTLRTAAFGSVDFVIRGKVLRSLHLQISPLGKDHQGALALLLLRDRTREAQIEKMRSDFVANASHELRTPLTTLSGFIETMQGAASKDEKARGEFLKIMKTQADRMSLLIDDLLSLSRIELDEHVTPNLKVDLGAVVLQTKNLLQSLLDESACELIIETPKNFFVQGDDHQLGQVVHNLIENAVKYSGANKRVTVLGDVQNGVVTLTVADNGPGIEAHHIPRLTERFYRANVQDSRARGGTGLGLAICKHIINRHRGRLEIESVVGTGSKFTVHLPEYK